MLSVGVIDPWINVDMPEWGDPPWMVTVATKYLGVGREALRRRSAIEVLDDMDRNGVARAVLDLNVDHPSEHTLSFLEVAPDRFAIAARVDPTRPMQAVRRLRRASDDLPVVMARVIPFLHDLPADHRCYYPLYAACTELGIPISVNAGIPGPPVPGECQHPIHLDRVCLDFPDLSVIMAHGADPWWSVAIRLMLKYDGLHLMTSAYRPKYLPPELVHFMRTRGRSKVLFSTDYPMLPFDACIRDARALGLPEDVLEAYLGTNAARLLYPG